VTGYHRWPSGDCTVGERGRATSGKDAGPSVYTPPTSRRHCGKCGRSAGGYVPSAWLRPCRGRHGVGEGGTTERRVRGHITVCFLAFTLRQILKQRLAEQSFAGSSVELAEGLSRVRAVLLDDGNGHRYRLRDEIPAGAMPAFQALKIVPPRRVEQLD
jgi:hypothetical protein